MTRSVESMDGLLLRNRPRFEDERGWFTEIWNKTNDGACDPWQLNMSFSCRGVLRGLHIQKKHPQAKAIWVVQGTIFDVVVDMRPDSKTFGKWWSSELHADGTVLVVPKGCAHGFLVVSDTALVQYLVDAPYRPDDELTLRFDDPDLDIPWPWEQPKVSQKDKQGVFWRQLDFQKGYPEVA